MKKRTIWWSALVVVLAIAVTVSVKEIWHFSAIQTQAATLSDKMRLQTVHAQVAPDFTLTDEHGKQLSLSDLKGKAVVVQFMDPECTDICPVVSSEVVGADKILADKQQNVVFVAVNVNEYHTSQADVRSFSQQHGLDSLPNWYFLTGTTSELRAVWKAYGIAVVPSKDGDVQHSSYMFFIDKNGNEQFIANPDNSKATILDWSQGIAFFVAKLI